LADTETTLVWSAIQNGDLGDVMARGIEYDHFADEVVADVYDWATQFYTTYGQPPGTEALSDEFPRFKARLSKEPTAYHIKRFIHQCKQRAAEEGLRTFFEMLEDPDEIDDIEIHALDFAQQLVEVVPAPQAAYFGRDAKKRKEQYDQRKAQGRHRGILLGIPSFDKVMMGMQPHELIVYAGPPGTGKTTGMQHTSVNAYLQGISSLFISLEVEREQILRKFDTMFSNVSYLAMKALTLDVGSERKWTQMLERAEVESSSREIVVRDDIRNCTAEKVIAEEIRYRPGLVVVDYLEEMRGRKGVDDWVSVRENARGLKQQARVSRIPHVTGTQINRDGDTAHQSIHKIADAIIKLEVDDDDETVMDYVLLKYRDGPSRIPAHMRWDLDEMRIEEIGHRHSFAALGSEKSNGKSHRQSDDIPLANPWTKRAKSTGPSLKALLNK
jgi:replicative DNA helicase